MGRSERTYTIGEACAALGLAPDGKTLRRWLQKAGFEGAKSAIDGRFRQLTLAQMKVLASAHGRALAGDDEVNEKAAHSPSVKALQLQIHRMQADIEALQAQVQSLLHENQPLSVLPSAGTGDRRSFGVRAEWEQSDASGTLFDALPSSTSHSASVLRHPIQRVERVQREPRHASGLGGRSHLPDLPAYLIPVPDAAKVHSIPLRTLSGAAGNNKLTLEHGTWKRRSPTGHGGYVVEQGLTEAGMRDVHVLYGNRPDFAYDPERCAYCKTLQDHYGALPPPAHAPLPPARGALKHGDTPLAAPLADTLHTPTSLTATAAPPPPTYGSMEGLEGSEDLLEGRRAPITTPLAPVPAQSAVQDVPGTTADVRDTAPQPAFATAYRRYNEHSGG